MNKNLVKRILLIALCVLLVAALVVGCVFGGKALSVKHGIEPIKLEACTAKNVVLMIGDGMGQTHVQVGGVKKGQPLFMTTLPIKGTIATCNAIGTVTDSAAAGTALSTGEKVTNGAIAISGLKKVETMTEYAIARGKSTGIIATETVTGATPASFSAHALLRGWTDTIFESQMEGEVDLFCGAGKDYFDRRTSQIESQGFTYATDTAEMDATAGRLFAAFNEISTDYADADAVTLRRLALFALEYLSAKNENGFFLMVEGSHIDKKSHSNEMQAMLSELLAFDAAVQAVVEWAQADGETLVIVTADHETGGLTYDNQTAQQLTDAMFTSGNHTGANVPYYIYSCGAISIEPLSDNTHIAKLCRRAFEASAQQPAA